MSTVEKRFICLCTVAGNKIEYFVGNGNDWKLSFKGQKLVIGKYENKDDCYLRIIDIPDCAGVKKHEFILQFQMTANYTYSKINDKTANLEFFRNNLKWNRILINTENLAKLDACFIAAPIGIFPNKRVQNYFKNAIRVASYPSHEFDEIIPSAVLTFSPAQKQKSFCLCFVLAHYYLKQVNFKILGNSPIFTFTNSAYFSYFTTLKELQISAQNFFHKSFAQLLIALKAVKTLNTLKLEGRHENLDTLFVNFPLQIKKLLLKKYNAKIPPSIENAINLEELSLDSVNGKLRSEIFSLRNFKSLTFLRRQYIRYLPATAMQCKVTNLSFLSYYIPTVTKHKAKEIPTLFEIAAGQIFTHKSYHSVTMAPNIIKRLRVIRTQFRTCTNCLKVFSKKMLCVQKMEKRGQMWFRHIFCENCYNLKANELNLNE